MGLMVAEQAKRLASLARDYVHLQVYEINPPDCEERPYPLYWVVNLKNGKGYEVDLENVRCSCYDYRVLHRLALDNLYGKKGERQWAVCKHLCRVALAVKQLEKGKAEIKYVQNLPEVCWCSD